MAYYECRAMMNEKTPILQVLVVDDEPLILSGMARYLRNRALVDTAKTAEEAIEAVSMKHYDLCFLDIRLPGMTGLDALEVIQRLSPGTKVTIMSGTLMDQEMRLKIEKIAHAFMEKPFDLCQIQKIVNIVEIFAQ
ncbi:MAG: response regulator [Desulfobulbaceae bacterium]|nr:response regulator [Desulfobulbaceae bacterium]